MIKGIFFDLGWTIFRPVNDNWFINQKMLEFTSMQIIDSLPSEKRKTAFNKALKYLDDNHLLFSEDEEVEQFTGFYKIIAAELPELGISAEQSKEIAAFKVADTSNFIFYEKARETVLKLKEKYKTGIISDTWPSADRILRSGGMDNLFETKTYSCNLGTWKPDEKMYFHALEQMGLPPEQTVFVDDWEPNLDGAAACGIQGILIKSRNDSIIPGQRFSENIIDKGKYPSINAIEELPELLKGM
ncbi:HAD-IA family hydrolase [Sedimentibacter sp.]|uniref:HAD family hydrolase n=1 Tax=Sedimentibacter sp. TaxID=1960295 RepID=UPI0028A082AB|nr:HAD-IA family hydrolase [Sedimentibacter sp.]